MSFILKFSFFFKKLIVTHLLTHTLSSIFSNTKMNLNFKKKKTDLLYLMCFQSDMKLKCYV